MRVQGRARGAAPDTPFPQVNHTVVLSTVGDSNYHFGATYVGTKQLSPTEVSTGGRSGERGRSGAEGHCRCPPRLSRCSWATWTTAGASTHRSSTSSRHVCAPSWPFRCAPGPDVWALLCCGGGAVWTLLWGVLGCPDPPPLLQTQQSKFVNWQVDGEFRGADFTAAVTLGNPDVLVGSGEATSPLHLSWAPLLPSQPP